MERMGDEKEEVPSLDEALAGGWRQYSGMGAAAAYASAKNKTVSPEILLSERDGARAACVVKDGAIHNLAMILSEERNVSRDAREKERSANALSDAMVGVLKQKQAAHEKTIAELQEARREISRLEKLAAAHDAIIKESLERLAEVDSIRVECGAIKVELLALLGKTETLQLERDDALVVSERFRKAFFAATETLRKLRNKRRAASKKRKG